MTAIHERFAIHRDFGLGVLMSSSRIIKRAKRKVATNPCV